MSQQTGETDLYFVLGVSRAASADQIKVAYRQMVRLHHPDANPAHREQAEIVIKTIIEAYGILGDPEKRARYDSETRLNALDNAEAARRETRHGAPASLLGRVRNVLGIDSHELAGKLGLADTVLREMEARDVIPTSPVQARTFANLCRRAASQLEQSGRGSDAADLRTALDRKLTQRAMYRQSK